MLTVYRHTVMCDVWNLLKDFLNSKQKEGNLKGFTKKFTKKTKKVR